CQSEAGRSLPPRRESRGGPCQSRSGTAKGSGPSRGPRAARECLHFSSGCGGCITACPSAAGASAGEGRPSHGLGCPVPPQEGYARGRGGVPGSSQGGPAIGEGSPGPRGFLCGQG